MKNKILSVVFILSLLFLPSNIALAGGGGGLTSIGKLLVVTTIVIAAGPGGLITLGSGGTLTGLGVAAIATGAAVGIGYIQCSGGQDNVSFEGCGGGGGGGTGGGDGSGGTQNTSGGGGSACVGNVGQPCNGAANACGQTGGTAGYVQCDGVCGTPHPNENDSYGDWTITGSPPPDTCDGVLGQDRGAQGFNGAFTCPAGIAGSCQDASWNCVGSNCATYIRPVTCSTAYTPVAPPPLPSNYGQNCLSPANSCGLRNGGSIGCTNNCSAQFPPPESQCENLNTGGTGTTLTANPPSVFFGGFTDLIWESDESSCTLYNATSGELLATSTSGTKREGPISSTRRYVLNCDPDIVSLTIIPQLKFEEF